MRDRRTKLTAAEWGMETPREMGSPLPPDEGDRRAERDRAVKAAWAKVDEAGLRDEVGLLVGDEMARRGMATTRYIADGPLDMEKARQAVYQPQHITAPPKAPRLLPSKDKAAERLAAFTVAQDKRRQEAAALNREIARARVEVEQDPALQARRKAALESMAKREQALVESARRRKQEWMTSPAGIHHENERLLRRAGRAMKATIRIVTGCRAKADVFKDRVKVTATVTRWGSLGGELVAAEVTLEQCRLFRTNLEQMATQVAANALEAHRVMVEEERRRKSETAFLRSVAHALKHRQLGMQGATATASKVDLSHREAADICTKQMREMDFYPHREVSFIECRTPIGDVRVWFSLKEPPEDCSLDRLFGHAKTYGEWEWAVTTEGVREYIKVKVLR